MSVSAARAEAKLRSDVSISLHTVRCNCVQLYTAHCGPVLAPLSQSLRSTATGAKVSSVAASRQMLQTNHYRSFQQCQVIIQVHLMLRVCCCCLAHARDDPKQGTLHDLASNRANSGPVTCIFVLPRMLFRTCPVDVSCIQMSACSCYSLHRCAT